MTPSPADATSAARSGMSAPNVQVTGALGALTRSKGPNSLEETEEHWVNKYAFISPRERTGAMGCFCIMHVPLVLSQRRIGKIFMVKHFPSLPLRLTYHSLYRRGSVSCTELPLALPIVRFLFPYAYLPDVLLRASLAQSLLVLPGTKKFPHPCHAVLAEWLYLPDRRPHHLIIALPSCTLRVLSFSSVFLTHHRLFAPPIVPPYNRLD